MPFLFALHFHPHPLKFEGSQFFGQGEPLWILGVWLQRSYQVLSGQNGMLLVNGSIQDNEREDLRQWGAPSTMRWGWGSYRHPSYQHFTLLQHMGYCASVYSILRKAPLREPSSGCGRHELRLMPTNVHGAKKEDPLLRESPPPCERLPSWERPLPPTPTEV